MKFLSMNSNMIFPFDVYLEWLFFLEWLNWKVQLNSNRNVISIEFFCKCFNQINESYLNVCIKIQRILTFCALLHENAALYIPIINDIQMNSIEKYAVTATHCILWVHWLVASMKCLNLLFPHDLTAKINWYMARKKWILELYQVMT